MKKSTAKNSKPSSPPPVEEEPLVPDLMAMGDDSGLSLEELAQTYAALLNKGSDPYVEPPVTPEPTAAAEKSELPIREALAAAAPAVEDDCEVSPRSILEALLFVGHPQNQPQTARQMAALMRGVSPTEVEELLADLQQEYDAEGTAYTIVSQDEGYRLVIRTEFLPLQERFYGRVREAKLSQGAVDVLAVVAYRQPIATDEVDAVRGRPSGALLNQLVRRDLLRVERRPETPRKVWFCTTDRFLDLFGLESLNDLPQSVEMDHGG